MVGLIFIGIFMFYFVVGGYEVIKVIFDLFFFNVFNLSWVDFFNWVLIIILIWFIGMIFY